MMPWFGRFPHSFLRHLVAGGSVIPTFAQPKEGSPDGPVFLIRRLDPLQHSGRELDSSQRLPRIQGWALRVPQLKKISPVAAL